VQVVDFFGNNGRITSAVTMGAFPGGAADLLPDSEATCFYAARYLINMPLMKGHTGQIFTFGAKNFYGITGINSDWTKNGGHHPYTASLTNFMISPNFGGKVILWCMDAMYPDANLDGTPDSGWAEAPFNGKPMSSFIMSLDGVAEESVSADFFSNHYGTGTTGQDYIVDAADSGAGVEEHWNNPVAKQYSRNLDSVKGTGIQLVRVQGDAVLPARGASQAPLLSIRRSGAALLLIVPRAGEYHLSIITLNGRVAFREVKHYAAAGSVTVPLARLNLPHGAYMAEVKSAGATISSRVEL